MTALEAYALAKGIAISAVSGVRNLSVDGTKLLIETNDGNTLTMEFPIPDGIKKGYYNSNDGKFYREETFENAMVGKTEIIYIDYGENKLYYFDGSLYNPLSGGGSSGTGTGKLENALTVSKTVGGISSGKSYPAGTGIEQILRDMLNPTTNPTLTNPSVTLTTTGSLIETGASAPKTLTANFNRGSISPAYGTNGYRAGAATGYSLNGGAEQSGNTFTVTVTPENKTFKVKVNYAEGPQPKNSSGQNYGSPLAAGSVESATLTFEFVDALWSNSAAANTLAKMDLISKADRQFIFDFPACDEDHPESFDIPASWTVAAIEVKNELTNAWDDCSEEFSTSTVLHDDANGNAVSYTRYTCNLGYEMGARNIRVKWA